MDPPGQPDHKRPRLSTNNNSPWSPTGSAPPATAQQPPPSQQIQHHLPPLHPPSLPPSLPPTPHQPHSAHQPPHHNAPSVSPYHQQPSPYPPRSAEPHHPSHPAKHHPDERRHHEQEPPYTPMQEHYRHPPSPAHHSYGPFHHRDPGSVKREPHEESLPHPLRPHSTGGAPPDGLPAPGPHPPPPHSAPPPVPQYSDDPRRQHMGYDNAPPPPMPPTPGGYRPNYPPPPMPQQPPQQYEQPPYHSQPPPDLSYAAYASTQKRKATRASQACDSCRQLKAKCDETKPCKSCREKGVECKYRDPVPKALDKSQSDILDGMHELKSIISAGFTDLQRKWGSMDRRIKSLEKSQPYKDVKVENDAPGSSPSPITAKTPASPDTAYQPARPEAPEDQPMAVGETALGYPVQEDADTDEGQEDEQPPGPAVTPGEPAIPLNHTTPAGTLLGWTGIRGLTQKALKDQGVKYIEEYPIGIEEKRGLLRLFGRGEGSGKIHGTTSNHSSVAAEQLHGSVEPGDDSYSEPSASPSPGEAWGQVGSLSPPIVSYSSQTLTFDGNPDYSEEKISQYVTSFEDNILTMHPIIMPNDLRNQVKRFSETVSMGEKRQKQSIPGIAKFVGDPQAHSQKRKRSPSGESDDPSYTPRKPGRPHRTIESALVLIVLALGKICLHRDKIPDPNEQPAEFSQSSPMNRNGHPSSPGPGGHTSPPAHQSQSSGLPSPKEQSNGVSSRRHSMQGGVKGGLSMKRNYESIPGLEYFAIATDILGGHHGGWTMKHVQTFIFAGLYYGQLGRVIQSHNYLLDADRALQIIMRRDLDRFQKIRAAQMRGEPVVIDNKRDNIVLLNFWTCLQLESDILAELNLPQSGVLLFEATMPWPNATLLGEDLREWVTEAYLAQLYLRKVLNTLHWELYSPALKDVPSRTKFMKALSHQHTLRSLGWVSGQFKFSEDDPPASNLVEARLRAKYWGTQTIIYRPLIRMIFDIGENAKRRAEGKAPESDTTGGVGAFTQDASTFVGHNVEGYQDLESDEYFRHHAREGIRALIKSTEAFHAVDQHRLLVTNIFGTAHAQWGNLLILAAAFRDDFLKQFIDGKHLHYLFYRTIRMLNMHAAATSALMIDKRILESIQNELFGGPIHDVLRIERELSEKDPRMSVGFSSTASAVGPTQPPLGPPPQPQPKAKPQVTNSQGPMSMAFAMQPNHSANNSPNHVHSVLNYQNHISSHAHGYPGQPATM